MKEFYALVFETLRDAWWPPVPEGQKRKVKVSAGGLALLLVVIGGGFGYQELCLIRGELAEVKTTSAKIWDALVARGIATASAPTPTPTPPPGPWAPQFVPDAFAGVP